VACLTAAFLNEARRARALGEEAVSIARIVGDPRLIGWTLLCLGHVAASTEESRPINLEAFASSHRAGDVYVASLALLNLGWSEADADFEAAHIHLEGAIAAMEEVGASNTLTAPMGEFSLVLLIQGDFERAAQMSRTTLIASYRQGARPNVMFMIFVLACCTTNAGDHRRAAQLTGIYDAFHDGIVETATFAYGWTAFREGMRDDNRSRLRTLMGKEEFERCYAAGTALSYEEAVDLALGRRSP
jgi:hypothetical protein